MTIVCDSDVDRKLDAMLVGIIEAEQEYYKNEMEEWNHAEETKRPRHTSRSHGLVRRGIG